jgi:hypothetical protein
MLGKTYRFSVNNQAGVSVTVTIKRLEWKFSSAGALVFGAETTDGTINALAVANSSTAWSDGATIDNSTNLYLGAELEVTLAPSASATGLVTVQIQRSLDGGTTWPTDGQGEMVGTYYFSASSSTVIVPMVVSGG